MRFDGKVAIVTGGTRGIGRAIVLRLAGEGATVAFCGRRAGEEEGKIIEEAKATGGEAVFFQADITDREDIGSFVKTVEERFGKVDILVNNAGWGEMAPFVDSDEAMIDKTIEINLRGPINVTKAVLGGMVRQGSGRIINISSDSGRIGATGTAVYSACKGGIISFTKSLAREMARYQINVNCVSPGSTNTDAFSEATAANPKLIEAINKTIPWGRTAEPAEIAAVVAFLASDDAGYITGQTVSVSGGSTMC